MTAFVLMGALGIWTAVVLLLFIGIDLDRHLAGICKALELMSANSEQHVADPPFHIEIAPPTADGASK